MTRKDDRSRRIDYSERRDAHAPRTYDSNVLVGMERQFPARGEISGIAATPHSGRHLPRLHRANCRKAQNRLRRRSLPFWLRGSAALVGRETRRLRDVTPAIFEKSSAITVNTDEHTTGAEFRQKSQ